jgi:hypothetical protein
MATSKINLTRNQLASFLQDHEQIKQFERLFSLVSELQPSTLQDLTIAAGNANQKAIEALDLISTVAQDVAIQSSTADSKASQALDALNRIASALEMLAAAPVIQHDNSVVTDYADFRLGAPVPGDVPGRVHWSDDDATLDLMLPGGVSYQFGQQLDFHPKNTSGVQINKGMAVMATGVVGSSTKITCARAVANGTVAAQYMLGVATQNIPNNQFGYVVWFGSIRGFNTTGANKTVPETWVNGDILYFDPAYPGELTKVQPAAPNLDLPIAIVTSVGNNGSIFVRMKTGETMNELHDVSAASPSSGNVLIYDAGQARWEAAAVSAGNGIALTPGAGSLSIAANLSAGSNISITGANPLTIAVTGLGTMAFQNTGISVTITTAKLTSGGADGSMTFTNGILTSQTQAT